MAIEKKAKTIYIFDKVVFDRGNSSLGCFNGATQNDGLWQSVPVRYHTRKKRYLSLLSFARRDKKDEKCMCRDCLKGGVNLSLSILATHN